MYRPLSKFDFSDFDLTPELNVYVHVPFCKQFCTFCGYFKTMYDEALQEQFVSAVVAEIKLREGCLRGRVVKTLHFGGGTPSLLSPQQLGRIVDALSAVNPKILETCLEVSIEATPESIEREKFTGYFAAGIRRVSMGVQSLVDREVRLANRCLEFERDAFGMLAEAVGTLREIGMTDVVVDLMIGIQEQTLASFEETVRRTISLRPETVQLYALGVMPQTALGRRKPSELMSGSEIYRCYELGRQLFLEAGYRRDSHDRYTLHPVNGFLQGDLNIRGMSLVGLGAGARSYSQSLHGRNTYAALNGRKALLEYMANVNSGRHSVESGVVLNRDEQMRQYAIGHILAIDAEEFITRFGVRYEQAFSQLHQEMIELELMKWEDPVWRLTERGLLFRDLLGRCHFSAQADELELAYRP